MKVEVEFNNGLQREFDDVICISKTIDGINIFGNEIKVLNIVKNNYEREIISFSDIRDVKIINF